MEKVKVPSWCFFLLGWVWHPVTCNHGGGFTSRTAGPQDQVLALVARKYHSFVFTPQLQHDCLEQYYLLWSLMCKNALPRHEWQPWWTIMAKLLLHPFFAVKECYIFIFFFCLIHTISIFLFFWGRSKRAMHLVFHPFSSLAVWVTCKKLFAYRYQALCVYKRMRTAIEQEGCSTSGIKWRNFRELLSKARGVQASAYIIADWVQHG